MARAIRASASSALVVHSEKGFDSRKLDEGRMAHPPFGMPLSCESNYGRLKIVPSQIGDTTPYQTTEMPNAAFSDREQVDKPASLDGKGRPGCHERPSYLDAWLSCAGSGELAPEVGIFNHNCFGPWLVSPTRSMTRVRCNIPGRGFVPRTGTEIPYSGGLTRTMAALSTPTFIAMASAVLNPMPRMSRARR